MPGCEKCIVAASSSYQAGKQYLALLSSLYPTYSLLFFVISDFGFAWTPHGTYARDLEHFHTYLGFTPHESVIAATAGIAKLFMRENELGKVQPGYYADCILVNGDPLQDIRVLQDHDKLDMVMINGRVHKGQLEVK